MVAPALVMALCLVILHRVLPDPIAPYVTGAVVMWMLCQIHQLGLDASGMTSRRLGILAEGWTADQLRALDRRSWHVIHHVMLEHRDVDHVAIGPAGVVAIETKFRSEWKRVDLERLAIDVDRQRRKVASRASRGVEDVRSVVAMWGPDVGPVREIHGVVLCPGRELTEWLNEAPLRFDDDQRRSAVAALGRYVARRDVGERREHGAAPTSLTTMINQLVAIVSAVVFTACVVAMSVQLPAPLLSIPSVVAASAAAAFVVRRSRSSDFAQRLTVAVLTTALAVGALMAIVATISSVST